MRIANAGAWRTDDIRYFLETDLERSLKKRKEKRCQ